VYGIGAFAEGRFTPESIRGLSARDLIARVAETPQTPGPAARTAAVLANAVRTSRQIDVELAANAAGDEPREGTPLALDDVVVPEGSDERSESISDTVHLSCSEPYVGGEWRA
jgi:hypothetical protein